MRRSPLRSSLLLFALFGAAPLLAGSGCKKDPVPVVIEAAPPPPEIDAAPAEILPMGEDAGVDAADAADAAKKWGPGGNTNVLRLKQCCAQIRGQAKSLGLSPEAGILNGIAAQCDGMAAQVGPNGNAPELGVLRGLLAGKTVPPACSGF